ncbi:MAG: iron dependent repressor, metal binding and dimerization domain protein [Anaerolineae bacterium]|nr:FeoA domain-containing protein [Thermoflexales bacterium]MDW8053859.1 iron dependent repressor, metal binding and dimerization domain protein [Anaerolineae bacterium]
MEVELALLALGVLALLVLAPRVGLLARYRMWRGRRERECIEDALKHLLNREHQGRYASPESLSGALSLSRAQTVQLIERMEARGLLKSQEEQLRLTEEGREWAVNVVRAHRLLERYLADEARMPLEQVHEEAQRLEHALTPEQVNALEAELGYPQRDPHGDPIPSRGGHLAREQSMPLTDLPLNTPARVVHIEDEPALAYQQVLAAGLKPGQVIEVVERTPQAIAISGGVSTCRLAPAIAANVSVVPSASPQRVQAIPLSRLPLHQEATIVALDAALQGLTRRRLLDLGLTPGATIRAEMQTPFGNPRAYRVRGTLIALRNSQADAVLVAPRPQQQAQGDLSPKAPTS